MDMIHFQQTIQNFAETISEIRIQRNNAIVERNDKQEKFVNSFTSLCFATLAISIQFGSKLGQIMPYMLILTWVLLFLASVSGGYWIMYTPEILRLFTERKKANEYLKMFSFSLSKESFIQFVRNGAFADLEDTSKTFTVQDVQNRIENEKKRLKFIDSETEVLEKRTLRAYKLMVRFYILGVFGFGLFAAGNYLEVNFLNKCIEFFKSFAKSLCDF